MNEQCIYLCGPYKDYSGRAEYDSEFALFHGEVMGTRDVVTFQGRNLAELRKAFCASVDDYLKLCEIRGERPEKPFSGKFVARINPALHKKVSMMAQASGKSLNQFLCECLEAVTEAESPSEYVPISSVKRRTGNKGTETSRRTGKKGDSSKRTSSGKPA